MNLAKHNSITIPRNVISGTVNKFQKKHRDVLEEYTDLEIIFHDHAVCFISNNLNFGTEALENLDIISYHKLHTKLLEEISSKTYNIICSKSLMW